jgi:DNA repair exonuclease SbcCD ATPase subunit
MTENDILNQTWQNTKRIAKDTYKKLNEKLTQSSNTVLGVVEEGAKLLSKSGIPVVSTVAGWFSWGADRAKDAAVDAKFSALASSIGDLQDGLNEVQDQIQAQGQALNGKIDDVKSELTNAINQQGAKFDEEIKNLDKKLANATGENKEKIEKEVRERKKEIAKVRGEMQRAINEVTENLNRVQTQLQKELNDFRNEVNERFSEQEQKILNNKRKIEDERRDREEEIRETHSKIKLTTTNLENLRKEKSQLEDEFLNYKSQINQKTADTQQSFEDLEAEHNRKTKILEAKIEDNQEQLEEFSEQLDNVHREQARQKAEQEEILEELEETNETLFIQQHKLNLVSQQMEDVTEELHQRMDEVQDDHNKLFTLTTETSEKVSNLTEEVKNIWAETEKFQKQIRKNKEELEKVKKEAKFVNERLDNFLKSQALSDFSSEQSNLDKIQKSLELKAEETKLLATLNLLSETKKLITPKFTERNWKVGINKGTADKDFPEPEGYQLVPNSWWERRYTGEQEKPDNPYSLFTQEWFNWESQHQLKPEQTKFEPWGERIKSDNENAPLTTPEKRKEEQVEESERPATEQDNQEELALEQLENLKTETLSRLSEIQQQISQNIQKAENTPKISKPKTKFQTIQEEFRKKKQLLQQKEQKITNLEKKPYSAKIQTKLEKAKEEREEAQQELAEVQTQLSDPSLKFEQELESQQEKIKDQQAQQNLEETQKQWQDIKELSKQALQDQPEQAQEKKGEQKNKDPEKPKESELDKKLEELVQQIKQLEENQAASQKQMTYAMLFLIIFLLEYVVYKRNGLPGLVILNVLLSIAYYYREQLKKYADLWGKYLLIIGYIMGNVLAYSAPEQEKYKWPAVAGFNACVLAIYAYTWYQQKQEQAKIEALFQERTQEIREEYQVSEQEWANIQQNNQPVTGLGGIIDEYSVFSNSGAMKIQQLSDLKEIITDKQIAEQIAQQKALEIQKQAETLQKAAEIEKKLNEAQENLGTPKVTWNRIKELYPEFENKSTLLGEFDKVDKWLAEEEVKSDQVLSKRLERLPILSDEEKELLSNLNLSLEQYIAISLKTPYLNASEKQFIIDNYLTLNIEQKLQLINSGLNGLEINSYEKKEKFVELSHTLHNEKELFGLSVKEKENILRFISNTLNLSEEQKAKLEEMGLRIYNASEWTITDDQKDHLLDFGLNKLKLTEEQQEQLAIIHPDQFRTFSLTGEQKNILNSLAPLIREDKYSNDSLELLKSLHLKPDTSVFLVNEEIIPDPHLAFGTPKSSYLPLKEKFLKGEQKTLRKVKEQEEKKVSEEKLKKDKLSILNSLMSIKDGNDLYKHNYTLSEWVNQGILTNWQADILLTCGFKTVPKYNFFDLFIFSIEKFTNDSWENILKNRYFAREFEKYLKHLKSQPITINQTIWEKFVSSQKDQPETIKQLNLKELIEEQVSKVLGNWKPIETTEENWKNIHPDFTPELIQAWKSKGFSYENTKEWINIGLNPNDAEFCAYLRDKIKTTPEKVLNFDQQIELRKQFAEYQAISEATKSKTPKTSRYDDLLSNLNKEDSERNKKKNERQVAKNKFEEAERTRREQKLIDKDQKLKEDEEKRQQEKELADKEEKKRREAEEARNKALQEEQNRIFNNKMKNIEDAKKRAEEALENQKKTNELAEQKKKDEIEKLQKENEVEQERLKKQAELIEEEKQKKLAAIALEDTEQRQKIQREADAEKARILQEANDKKRKNEEELKKKENELLKQQENQKVEIERLQKEADLQNRMAEETKRIGREQERILKANRDKDSQARAFRESLWNEVKNYYWASNEARDGTRDPQITSGGYLRNWLNSYPNMKFNLVGGDQFSCNWTNNSWKTAMQAFYRTAGNTFVTQSEFLRLLEQKVLDTNFLN